MGRRPGGLDREVRSSLHLRERLFDKRDPAHVEAIATWDWHAAAPVRAWIEDQERAWKERNRRTGTRPVKYPYVARFGVVLLQRRLGIGQQDALTIVERSPALRDLYGFEPIGGEFPQRQSIDDLSDWWVKANGGDLSALRRWTYCDIPALSIALYGIPVDRFVIDARGCASPQQLGDDRLTWTDEGAGMLTVKVNGKKTHPRGRYKLTILMYDGATFALWGDIKHGEEKPLFRDAGCQLPAVLDDLLAAVGSATGRDVVRSRVTLAGDSKLWVKRTIKELRTHGIDVVHRRPERMLIGTASLRLSSHRRRADARRETREVCTDGAILCPCDRDASGVKRRTPMTRRANGAESFYVTCRRVCEHAGKVFLVSVQQPITTEKGKAGADERATNRYAAYSPAVSALAFLGGQAIESYHQTMTREHNVGHKVRGPRSGLLWGQFNHELHYTLVDALHNLDVARNLDRLGGIGPAWPWELAEDSAIRNSLSVARRKAKSTQTEGPEDRSEELKRDQLRPLVGGDYTPLTAAAARRLEAAFERQRKRHARLALPAHDAAMAWLNESSEAEPYRRRRNRSTLAFQRPADALTRPRALPARVPTPDLVSMFANSKSPSFRIAHVPIE